MYKRGFTLLEVLLSIACIALLAGISAPIYSSFYKKNEVLLTRESVIESLYRASSYARNMEGQGRSWGVYFDEEKITLFEGGSYLTADPESFEEMTYNGDTIVGPSPSEIIFLSKTGYPNFNEGLWSITVSNSLESYIIIVNPFGMISYE